MSNPADIDDGDEEQDADEPYAQENARLEGLLSRHAAVLAEHFEAVRIIAVVNRGDGVYARISKGQGNYFAQYGAIRDWLVETEQATRDHASE